MPDPLVSLAEIKSYLGITHTDDDALLGDQIWEGTLLVEQDTSRVFAVASNVSRTYSTNGNATLTIHDRPMTDATRSVTLAGAALSETTGSESVWFLEDWRARGISTTIQLRHFDYGRHDWFKADPEWYEKNLDKRPYSLGTPNDLVITGVEGHLNLPDDVFSNCRRLIALLYWQAKAGASGFVQLPTGEELDLTANRPEGYDRFVNNWKIRTAVASV